MRSGSGEGSGKGILILRGSTVGMNVFDDWKSAIFLNLFVIRWRSGVAEVMVARSHLSRTYTKTHDLELLQFNFLFDWISKD